MPHIHVENPNSSHHTQRSMYHKGARSRRCPGASFNDSRLAKMPNLCLPTHSGNGARRPRFLQVSQSLRSLRVGLGPPRRKEGPSGATGPVRAARGEIAFVLSLPTDIDPSAPASGTG